MRIGVVLGVLGVAAAFSACRGRTTPPGPGDDTGDAGAPLAGEGPGGTAGSGGSGINGGRDAGTGGRPGGAGGAASVAGKGGSGGTGAGGGTGVSGAAGAGTAGAGGPVPCGQYDCARLANVRPGAPVSCVDGVCVIPPESCLEGFAHCSSFVNTGCEADLHSPTSCGTCDIQCLNETQFCTQGPEGWHCSQGCEEPTPDRCYAVCTDLDTDPDNCGNCNNRCSGMHVTGECQGARCVAASPCDPGYGDCDSVFGCETELTTEDHCGVCRRKTCGAAYATSDCSSPDACAPPLCVAGRGNCDPSKLDCEATFGAACFPTYAGTTVLAEWPHAVAIADGGSFVVTGVFTAETDFDPSLGVDVHSPVSSEGDAYVVSFDADGTYRWVRTFSGVRQVYATAVAVGADGSIVVAGTFASPVDFDPGPGTELLEPDPRGEGTGFVLKLSAAGELVWARTLLGAVMIRKLALDASQAVVAGGEYFGVLDFDPGAGTEERDSGVEGSGFVLKLDASGGFAWAVTANVYLMDVSLAPDGSLWAVGKQEPPATLLGAPLGEEAGLFLAELSASGALGTLWSPGSATSSSSWPKVAAGANVHVTGGFRGLLDADPGAGSVNRAAPPGFEDPGFALSVDTSGAYRHVHAFTVEPTGAAAMPDGGSLFMTSWDLVAETVRTTLHAFYPDGTSAWSLRVGDTLNNDVVAPTALTSSSTHFAVWGQELASADYDPGPGTDTVAGTAWVMTRYAF